MYERVQNAALRSHGFLKRSRRQDFQFLFDTSLVAKNDTPIGAADATRAPHDLVLPAFSPAATFPGIWQQRDSSIPRATKPAEQKRSWCCALDKSCSPADSAFYCIAPSNLL